MTPKMRTIILSVTAAAALIFSAVVVIGVAEGVYEWDLLGHGKEKNTSSDPARSLSLTPHATISINGNAGFTNASGVSSGSGTADDPYVIENLDINASAANGISISNTDAYFTVRGCFIHDGYPDHYGIYMYRCSNGTIAGNNCSDDAFGIFVYLSVGDTVEGNIHWNCTEGIRLYSAENITTVNNTCVNNQWGIDMTAPANCTIAGNNCSGNIVNGIYMSQSDRLLISNNTISWNGNHGVIATSSENITFRNNTLCNNTECGVSISYSSNFSISNCLFSGNGFYGLRFNDAACSDNIIWNNTFRYNRGSGDVYVPWVLQASDDGTNNHWNSSDGYGNFWSDWKSPDVDGNGIVDSPYVIAGSAGAQDYYPRTDASQIPEFGWLPVMSAGVVSAFLFVRRMRTRYTRRDS